MKICLLFRNLALPLLVSAAASLAQAQIVFHFAQSGFSGGGQVQGSFTAVDLDSNGWVEGGTIFGPEVIDFELSFTGDSVVPDAHFTLGNLAGLVYHIGSPLLGDEATGNGEGLAMWESEGYGWKYGSGVGPSGGVTQGGHIYNEFSGAMSGTESAIRILPGGAVPESSTYGLIGAALLAGLALVRRVRNRR